MKYWVFLLMMILGCRWAQGQQQYFVYLQTENHQPFYVRLGDKVYSSAESGYLILSKLADSSQTFSVGFPRNRFPEQLFTIPVSHHDQGFLLKNFGDKGWGLLNLRTMALIMNNAGLTEKKNPENILIKKTDPFSVLLANAVNDTAVLFTVVKPKPQVVAAAKEAGKKGIAVSGNEKADAGDSVAPQKALAKTETPPPVRKESGQDSTATVSRNPVAGNNHPPSPAAKTITGEKSPGKTIADAPVEKLSPAPAKRLNPTATGITKAAELRTDTSYIAVYTDASDNNEDTVRISIPFDRFVAVKQPDITESSMPDTAVKEKIAADNSPAVAIAKQTGAASTSTTEKPVKEITRQKDSSNFAVVKQNPAISPDMPAVGAKEKAVHADSQAIADIKKPEPAQAVIPTAKDSTVTIISAPPKATAFNPNCRDTAWDSDIDKLRIKMIVLRSDEDKIILASKLFKIKCFTVKQVRALSELFTTDEAKYKWFDATYSYVTDPPDFPKLSELLTDKYYLNRFKAMLR
jgi:hypothetical protein